MVFSVLGGGPNYSAEVGHSSLPNSTSAVEYEIENILCVKIPGFFGAYGISKGIELEYS
jgi:hypothetical protein